MTRSLTCCTQNGKVTVGESWLVISWAGQPGEEGPKLEVWQRPTAKLQVRNSDSKHVTRTPWWWIIQEPEYLIGLWLHNNMVQCFYYANNNWATCFDPPRPSSGYKIMVTVSLYIKIQYVIKCYKNAIVMHYTSMVWCIRSVPRVSWASYGLIIVLSVKPRDPVGSVTACALVNTIIL